MQFENCAKTFLKELRTAAFRDETTQWFSVSCETEFSFCMEYYLLYEIKCRLATVKAAFNKMKTLFSGTLDLNLRKKLVKCYIWSTALCVAETGTVRAVDKKQLGSFEMWC